MWIDTCEREGALIMMKILGDTLQNFVAQANRRLGFVHNCLLILYIRGYASFPKQISIKFGTAWLSIYLQPPANIQTPVRMSYACQRQTHTHTHTHTHTYIYIYTYMLQIMYISVRIPSLSPVISMWQVTMNIIVSRMWRLAKMYRRFGIH